MPLLQAFLLILVFFPVFLQVESTSLSASFLVSRSIREVAYGLLLGTEQPHNSQKTRQTGQGSTQQLKSDSGPPQDFITDEEKRTDLQLGAVSKESFPLDQGVQMPSPVKYPETDTAESSTSAPGTKESEMGIVEYTRHNLELWRIAVQPCIALSKFGSIPSMEFIHTLSQQDKRAILLETLGVTADFVGKFEPDLQLYMVCLVFWARTASPSVTLHHLRGVVLSAVLLHVRREISDRENQMIDKGMIENRNETDGAHVHPSGSQNHNSTDSETSTCKVASVLLPNTHSESEMQSAESRESEREDSSILSITRVCFSADDKVLEKIQDNLKKYYHNPAKISSKNPPEHETFHRSAQFQACLLDAVHLNSLLQCPLQTPQPAVFFNGSFVYTIIHELQARSNPDLFLSEMLVKGSVLGALFKSLCSLVVQEAGEGVLDQQASPGKKCCKSTKRKKKNKVAASESQGMTDKILFEGSQAGEFMVASCDLSNRFGALSVEEDS